MIQTAGLPPSATGAFGLLKVGLSISAAEVQIRTWTTQRTFEKSNTAVVHFVSLRRFWAGAIYPLSLTLLMISLLFLALIIAATVTMFRVDIETRQAEFALRTALGANSRRLLSLLFFETAIIVLAGVTVSLSLSSLLIHLTVGYLSLTPGLYGTLHGLDIAVALGASLATVIIAVAIQRVALSQSFRHQSVGYGSVASSANVLSTATKTIVWPRLPIQPMLVTVIVVIAMLLVRSAYRIRHLSLGVRTDDTFVCEISMFTDLDQFVAKRIRADASTAEREMMFTESSRSYHEMMNSSLTEVLAELAKSPSVRSAGVISTAPYRNHQPWATDAHVSNGRNVADRSMVVHNVAFRSITPDVIPALGMTLVYGRGFTGRAAQDRDTVIINRAMADKLGSWSDAMAQYIELATLRRARVVGIVNNVYEQSVQEEVWPTVYFPFSEYGVSDVDLVVRTRHDATGSEVARLIDRSLHSVDERAIASHFARLSDMVESAGTLTRYTAAYLFALAIVSVFLAGFCTSAAILADFHGRRREVGIRLALGATAFNIVISFVLGSLLRNGISMVLGVFLAWSLSRLLSHLVLDVGGNFDLGGYIIAVSALAGYILTIQVVVMGSALQRTPRDLLS
jgi:ABC-type antimicrobial peptide transport system permease subunit